MMPRRRTADGEPLRRAQPPEGACRRHPRRHRQTCSARAGRARWVATWSDAGGGAWIGDLGVGGDVDEIGHPGVEGPAQGRADVGRSGDELTGAAERAYDLVVTALRLQVGGDVIAVQ